MAISKKLCSATVNDWSTFDTALRASLAVLMNLTHSNSEGARLASEAGICECAAELLQTLCSGGGGDSLSRPEDRQWLLAGLDVISISLGLLINLVEGDGLAKKRITSWEGDIIKLLVHIMEHTGHKHSCRRHAYFGFARCCFQYRALESLIVCATLSCIGLRIVAVR